MQPSKIFSPSFFKLIPKAFVTFPGPVIVQEVAGNLWELAAYFWDVTGSFWELAAYFWDVTCSFL